MAEAKQVQNKSEYVLNTYSANATITIEDTTKRMHMNMSQSFGNMKFQDNIYEIYQAGANFYIRQKGVYGKEAVVDINYALSEAVKLLSIQKD